MEASDGRKCGWSCRTDDPRDYGHSPGTRTGLPSDERVPPRGGGAETSPRCSSRPFPYDLSQSPGEQRSLCTTSSPRGGGAMNGMARVNAGSMVAVVITTATMEPAFTLAMPFIAPPPLGELVVQRDLCSPGDCDKSYGNGLEEQRGDVSAPPPRGGTRSSDGNPVQVPGECP